MGPTPLATALWERNGYAGQGRGDVDLRLAALRESPHAFWAKLSDEQRYSREQWTSFLGAVAWFVARQDNGPAIGMAGLLQQDPGPQLISMWVALHQRGQGIGARLTRAVVDLATGQGVPWRSVDTLPAYHDAAAGGHQLVIGSRTAVVPSDRPLCEPHGRRMLVVPPGPSRTDAAEGDRS